MTWSLSLKRFKRLHISKSNGFQCPSCDKSFLQPIYSTLRGLEMEFIQSMSNKVLQSQLRARLNSLSLFSLQESWATLTCKVVTLTEQFYPTTKTTTHCSSLARSPVQQATSQWQQFACKMVITVLNSTLRLQATMLYTFYSMESKSRDPPTMLLFSPEKSNQLCATQRSLERQSEMSQGLRTSLASSF
jgi:hypothetical protein